MADTLQSRIFDFRGGYATDFPNVARDLVYWSKAENVIFEVSGVARKLGGATKINATAITGSPDVTGMFDFWRGGGAAAFTQKFVAMVANSKIWKEDMDGTFDDITGAATITADAIPVFCQARDLLLIFDDKNDTPLKWNQTGNVATLGGSPPAGRGAVFHANRVWTWGANANPSRLTYGSSTDAEDYTGTDTGSIDLEPEDGDRIIGAVSFKQVLLVFKGPNKGSIHQISGTAPTGADAFSRKVMVRGIPIQTHNSLIPVGDDILLMSDRAIHSLAATQEFGNFAGADITHFLKGFFRDSIATGTLNKVWGVDYADKSCLLWSMPGFGNTENTLTFGLSYARLAEEGWKPFVWTRAGTSMAIRINPTTKRRQVVFGTTDGFAAIQDTTDRNIYDSTAYSINMRTPEILLGPVDAAGKQRGDQEVTLEQFWLRSTGVGDHNINATITRDNMAVENYSFAQQPGRFLLSTSILNVDTLGSDKPRIVYSDPKVIGSARAVAIEFSQGGLNQDANMIEFGLDFNPISQTTRRS